MLKHLRYLVARLRSSLWLVPSLIVTACVVAAVGMIELDALFEDKVLSRWPRLFGAGAEGARGMLATIAGSMITVAGVVFSITIVALSLASTQYSPRVLRNFLEDRTNQVVLGVFVGIFAYCLVVLRTIRGESDGNFVPSIAVLFAVVLAFAGIFVLILFIHHIANAIQASHILAAVERETVQAIERLFPQPLGEGDDDVPSLEAVTGGPDVHWQPICSEETGYLQSVDTDQLMALACEHETLIWLQPTIGDFVVQGTALFFVKSSQPVADELATALRELTLVGRRRTLEQDAAFGFRQIVDVALKALSPGINDMTTAVMCIDYLSSLYVRIAIRHFESPYRYRDGELRVIAHGPAFAALIDMPFEEIRLAAHDQPVVLLRLLNLLRVVGQEARSPSRRKCLKARAEDVLASARQIADVPQRGKLIAAAECLIAELAAARRPGPVLPRG